MQLQWTPTVMHDLHEAQTYLYSSTGTGPYNDALDPIVISEWWQLAQHDVLEMTKRGVPGVFTYGFYDGWVPNYMFFIAHSHNAIGRFYEVQSYGPDNYVARASATASSKEWFRPNPPLPEIKWGPRNNTNIQQSALLFSLNHVARNREAFLENYWLKNKRAVDEGQDRAALRLAHSGRAAAQGRHRRRRQRAAAPGPRDPPGRQRVHRRRHQGRGRRLHRPRRSALPDAGRDVLLDPELSAAEPAALRRHRLDVPVHARHHHRRGQGRGGAHPGDGQGHRAGEGAGGIEGTGRTLVVEHTADNALVTFRFKNPGVAMAAAEEDFELAGRKFRAGAIIVPNADRAALEPMLKDLGLSAWAVDTAPSVRTPRSRPPAHRLRAQLDPHAGRGLGAGGARHLRSALHLLRRPEAEGRTGPAEQVRRDRLPARRRHGHRAGQRHGDDRQRAVAVPARPTRRRTSASSIRATTSAAAWASRGSPTW